MHHCTSQWSGSAKWHQHSTTSTTLRPPDVVQRGIGASYERTMLTGAVRIRQLQGYKLCKFRHKAFP